MLSKTDTLNLKFNIMDYSTRLNGNFFVSFWKSGTLKGNFLSGRFKSKETDFVSKKNQFLLVLGVKLEKMYFFKRKF